MYGATICLTGSTQPPTRTTLACSIPFPLCKHSRIRTGPVTFKAKAFVVTNFNLAFFFPIAYLHSDISVANVVCGVADISVLLANNPLLIFSMISFCVSLGLQALFAPQDAAAQAQAQRGIEQAAPGRALLHPAAVLAVFGVRADFDLHEYFHLVRHSSSPLSCFFPSPFPSGG